MLIPILNWKIENLWNYLNEKDLISDIIEKFRVKIFYLTRNKRCQKQETCFDTDSLSYEKIEELKKMFWNDKEPIILDPDRFNPDKK